MGTLVFSTMEEDNVYNGISTMNLNETLFITEKEYIAVSKV